MADLPLNNMEDILSKGMARNKEDILPRAAIPLNKVVTDHRISTILPRRMLPTATIILHLRVSMGNINPMAILVCPTPLLSLPFAHR